MVAKGRKRTGYFAAYGGWSAVVRSPYARWSLGTTLVAAPMWLAPGWWNVVIAVSPALLGFALAAFALTMGMGDESFRKVLSGDKDGKPSPLIKVAATFTHFIVVQCLALGLAIVAKVYFVEAPEWLLKLAPWTGELYRLRHFGWFIGVWLFAYALFLTVAAAKGLFTYMGWFDKWVGKKGPVDADERAVSPPHQESAGIKGPRASD